MEPMQRLARRALMTAVFGALTAISASAQPTTQIARMQFDPNLFVKREQTASPIMKQTLASTRTRIQQQRLTFTVGYTSALEIGIDKLAGGLPITNNEIVRQQNTRVAPLLKADNDAIAEAIRKDPNFRLKIPILKLAPQPTMTKWDWRSNAAVTPIRRQLAGTCWAYAAVASLESGLALRGYENRDASEQYVVSNSGAGTVAGGYCYKAVDYLVNAGTTTDALYPDNGTNGTPNPGARKTYKGLLWGFVKPDGYGMATVPQIKQALCTQGPVTTWVDAGGSFGAYTGGIYNDNDDKAPGHKVGGHFVLIVGWDDTKQAWLIKNSWGPYWGETCGLGTERGYMWIRYGCHQIGRDATWIRSATPLPTFSQVITKEKLRRTNILTRIQNP